MVADEFADLPGVEQVVVFGSWAARYRGEAGSPSREVDVLVVGTPIVYRVSCSHIIGMSSIISTRVGIFAGQSVVTEDMNKLANFVFMSSQDNKTLGGTAPSVYRGKDGRKKAVPKILERALRPPSLFDDDFDSSLQIVRIS